MHGDAVGHALEGRLQERRFLSQRRLRPLALGDVLNDARHPYDRAVVGLHRKVVVLETSYQPRMSRGFRIDRSPDYRFPCFDDIAELRFDARRHIRNYLADCPSQVVIHRNSVDCGEPAVDKQESQVSVEIAEADRHVPVYSIQPFRQLIS